MAEEAKDAAPGEVTECEDDGGKEYPDTCRGFVGGEIESRDMGRDEGVILSLCKRRIIELRRSGRGKDKLGSARVGILNS